MAVPKFSDFMQPTMRAIFELGGTATTDEIYNKVVVDMHLSDDDLQEMLNSSTNLVKHRLGWARTYLKMAGAISNSHRGVWELGLEYRKSPSIDVRALVLAARKQSKKETSISDDMEDNTIPDEERWKSQLVSTLHSLSPSAFERLAQRLLRELGFEQVEVTGRCGDEGIDGRGVVLIHEIIGFHMIFQCKRYKWTRRVTSGDVRNFRGAMTGRTDKGIFITTSSFTADATREAAREGTFQIDLIDGEKLADIMRRLRLGITERTIYSVDNEWFQNL